MSSESCGADVPKGLALEVDGEDVPLNDFVTEIVANVLVGIVASLKGVEDPKQIVFRLDR